MCAAPHAVFSSPNSSSTPQSQLAKPRVLVWGPLLGSEARPPLDASSLGGRPRLGSLPRLPCQAWRVGTCFGLCPLVWVSRSSCGPTNIPLDTKTAKGEGLPASALRSSKATLVHGHLRYFVHSMHIADSEVQGSCRRLSRLVRPTCGLRASMNWAWVIICYSKACQEDPA